jgi:hypothetical protein
MVEEANEQHEYQERRAGRCDQVCHDEALRETPLPTGDTDPEWWHAPQGDQGCCGKDRAPHQRHECMLMDRVIE